ncbi:glycosyltransferase family 4 protein [Janibacter sp. YB324]|uniref:glycosyltransferase family 4 protein n=1 Tax=Janibacter sp. YB324 TaxID=2761047 RepID=UPI00162625B7|nr:glycosyltransferase family 4 protein [Janibacter sp. YB324]QNF93453.1 glycosyltransferase family 4 protein [Janibacter sp. YB324]
MTGRERPLRVWLAPSAFHPSRGGVEELTLQLAREYLARGHEVTVVVHRHPADLPSTDVVEGVPVRRVALDLPGSHPRRLAGFPFALRRQLRDLDDLGPRPDLVHVQCASNQVLALSLWTTLRRVPLVLTTQGEVTMDAGRIYQRSAQIRAVLRLGSRRAAALTACSRRAGDDAADIARRFRGCEVVPNGVDPDQWTVTPLPEAPVFAAWGRHVPQKGLDLLLDAFTLVRRELPDAVLRIGGDGPEHEQLRAMAGPGVDLLGPLDRGGVQALLTSARVAVVPSRLEPFGIVAVEAMAAGRGVVWSTNGGLADATAGLGQPADPTDAQALAAAMVRAHRDPVEPGDARAHAESLAWARIGERYLALYRDVCGRDGSRS